MLDPVVIPLPLALAVIAALAAALAYRRWLERPIAWTARPPAPTGGRHRLADRTEPFRDWAAITAERMYESHCRQAAERMAPHPVVIPGYAIWHEPLTGFERRMGVMEIAGHDDRPTEVLHAGVFGIPWDTERLALTR